MSDAPMPDAIAYHLCPRCFRATPEAAGERYCPNDGSLMLRACTACGSTIRSPYGRFCPACGEPYGPEPAVAEPGGAGPSVAGPSVAEPSVTGPSVAEPELAGPGGAEPEADPEVAANDGVLPE